MVIVMMPVTLLLVTMRTMIIGTMRGTAPVCPLAMMSAPKYNAGSTSGTTPSSAPVGKAGGQVVPGEPWPVEIPEDKYMIFKGFNSEPEKRPKVLKLGGKRRILWFNSLDQKTVDVLNPWNFRNLTTISAASG